MGSVRVPGFEPVTNGFQFANAFPHSALRSFKLGSIATLDVGDAANGLCGGMSFSTADLHIAGLRPPPDTSPPASDTPAYRYIVDRQITSFDDGRVPLRFYSLMRPSRPERESAVSAFLGVFGIDRHSRTWVMIHEEWPRIRADLDAGRLSMVGLVRVVDADPKKLGRNHQVVAYGYDLEGSALTIRIYDPNWPRDPDVTISLDLADERGAAMPTWSKPDAGLFCFFRTPYAPADPVVFRP
jgi:hypothetical protein